ncbi:MAG: MFS transporter [Sandaracinaceae bacterium]
MAGPPSSGGDEPKAPFGEQVASLGSVYWIANWMELVERFAYYGVRTVLPVFMVLSIADGGPEITHVQKGGIYAIWALVQSYVPIFSGTYADRYGYKVTIALSTVLKIIGYLLMGYCIALSDAVTGVPLAEARPQHADLVYEIFFAGAMFLALGTAIFKPGLQGLIAQQIPDKASGLGWGFFYQMVNIGGFIGPLIAGYLRVLEWEYVFLACAGGITLNFLPLFAFREPEKSKEPDRRGPLELTIDAVGGLLEPRLFYFTIAFAGFWLMFYQLFDILPNYIDDWVDSRAIASGLIALTSESVVPTVNGGNLTQEWLININALLISIFAFGVGYATGKMRSLAAIVVGIAISAIAIYALGMDLAGWAIVLAIALFSLGEMMASPTKMRYLSGIAPPGRKGQYMGYVNMTVGIGWSIGSLVAGNWYEENGDKINLARRYMEEELHVAGAAQLERGEVLERFYQVAHVDPWQARELLFERYDPNGMWVIFALIGLLSMLMLIFYDRVVAAAEKRPSHTFNTRGRLWVRALLAPITAISIFAFVRSPEPALGIVTGMFLLLLVASFLLPEDRATGPKQV